MMALEATWTPSTLNRETSSNGAFQKLYSKHLSRKTSSPVVEFVEHKSSSERIPVSDFQKVVLPRPNKVITSAATVAAAAAAIFAWVDGGAVTESSRSSYDAGYSIWGHSSKAISITKFADGFELYEKLPWLADFYEEAATAKTAKSIYPLVSGISKLFGSKDYETVDRLLQHAPLDRLSPTALATLVRTTYPAKSKLNNWTSTVQAVYNKLDSQGLDASRILRGLV